jgi:hypothetical protein
MPTTCESETFAVENFEFVQRGGTIPRAKWLGWMFRAQLLAHPGSSRGRGSHWEKSASRLQPSFPYTKP